ncbi:aminopeptidase N [Kordia sp. SMS9]|uniref:M1 family metallopeptidase n=1 Tax=Kordia sp. SMS9 TaxID=2282170 RepID=UPI000E0D6E19|nr:M1 family metallopeptidase [Kordia sp. SMS9]AXG68677.1 aminopeptidase N [Kordia sp. SMS9]
MTHKNNNFAIFLLFTFVLLSTQAFSQNFTKQDTLRGSITPERAWWDLTHYHLDIKVDPTERTISGSNTIQYKVVKKGQKTLQVDLQPPLQLTKAMQDGVELQIRHDGNAHFIYLDKKQELGKVYSVEVFYEGKPKVAKRPPWDGGITWSKDANGLPFVASSCQGLGASVWWPCKDHMYDEVDSMKISVNVPKNLMNVSNGRLIGVDEKKDDTKTYHWNVLNPINNYGVNINIGDYVHFGEKYKGENGMLDMDYYVLRDNLEKAKVQFKDAARTMEAFEHWFGPYPFYEDSYKLVEAPYLGMEHQSSVTYGNGYKNGYRGFDLSRTGWGMKFDFIIVHESGHEWFANNITNIDIADMWIHESFTAYSENLFLDYFYGKEASAEYVIGTRRSIANDRPIIGMYNVNHEGSGDMYYKGSNMLHTIRQLVRDDSTWRSILRGLNKDFYHQTVTTQQIEDYISEKSGINLSKVFDQYLRTTKIPVLRYKRKDNQFVYRWENVVDHFDMKVQLALNNKLEWLSPTTEWQTKKLSAEVATVELNPNFYVMLEEVK